MDSAHFSFMKAAGIRVAHAAEHARPNQHGHEQTSELLHERSSRYSGIPTIPADIGHVPLPNPYHGGKDVTGKKASGVTSSVLGNPAVPIGMGLTAMALLGMLRKSLAGDRAGTQQYMRFRIYAQGFTVLALCAGVVFFGSGAHKTNGEED